MSQHQDDQSQPGFVKKPLMLFMLLDDVVVNTCACVISNLTPVHVRPAAAAQDVSAVTVTVLFSNLPLVNLLRS